MQKALLCVLFAALLSLTLASATTINQPAAAHSGLSVFDIGATLPPVDVVQPRLVSATAGKSAPAPSKRAKPAPNRGSKPMDECAEDEGGGDCVHGPNFPPDPTDPGGGGGSGGECHWVWYVGIPVLICT